MKGYFIIFFSSIFLFSSCISSKKITRKNKINNVISEARSYLGTPYKWGGNTRKGIDCSGLLVKSFESAGIRIPRTTGEQIELGKKISLNKSLKGDLVFFAFGKSKRKVTHVGVISKVKSINNKNFIHASSSKGVIETQLFKDYYLKRIKKIKRIF